MQDDHRQTVPRLPDPDTVSHAGRFSGAQRPLPSAILPKNAENLSEIQETDGGGKEIRKSDGKTESRGLGCQIGLSQESRS
jgi:hypothetical protein